MVTFTGSETVGKQIGEACGRHVKSVPQPPVGSQSDGTLTDATSTMFRPALLELGGKACALVLETADLEAAAHTVGPPDFCPAVHVDLAC